MPPRNKRSRLKPWHDGRDEKDVLCLARRELALGLKERFVSMDQWQGKEWRRYRFRRTYPYAVDKAQYPKWWVKTIGFLWICEYPKLAGKYPKAASQDAGICSTFVYIFGYFWILLDTHWNYNGFGYFWIFLDTFGYFLDIFGLICVFFWILCVLDTFWILLDTFWIRQK